MKIIRNDDIEDFLNRFESRRSEVALDVEKSVAEFLQNTSVGVEDNTLTIRVVLDPEVVIAAIE